MSTGRELARIERRPPPNQDDPAEALRTLVRMAGTAWLKSAGWGLALSVRAARAAADPVATARLLQDVSGGVRTYAREFLGVAELEARIAALMRTPAGEQARGRPVGADALRERGAELLRQSADLNGQVEGHPAYLRILEELAPDEARILRLLAEEGDQPAVDVRASQLIGLGSQAVAEGLNMIGQEAGVRYVDRIHSYLNNLFRLGLIWFSKEPLDDPARYQVLEAQPAVLAALKSPGRTRSVQRSIRLTPFGRDFCETCLPVPPTGPRPARPGP